MQIAGDDLRPHVENVEHARDGLLDGTPIVARFVEIADMLETKASRPRVTVTVVLRCAPSASDAGAVVAKIDRLRHEAARAAQKGRRAVDHRHHAIVGARDDGAIMADDEIGDAASFSRASSSSTTSGSPPGLALVATSAKSCGASRQRAILGRPPPRETADDAAAHRAA